MTTMTRHTYDLHISKAVKGANDSLGDGDDNEEEEEEEEIGEDTENEMHYSDIADKGAHDYVIEVEEEMRRSARQKGNDKSKGIPFSRLNERAQSRVS